MRCPSSLEIQSYIDEELAPAAAIRINNHLDRCRDCRELARDLTATGALLGTLAEVHLPPSVRRSTAVLRPAQNRSAWRRWFLLPAAATLILTALVVRRHLGPAVVDKEFISAFVEAHHTSAVGEDIPQPCDFGLGGGWQ